MLKEIVLDIFGTSRLDLNYKILIFNFGSLLSENFLSEKMNFSKLEVKSIYDTMPERIRIKPIGRFTGKDFYKCGNNIFVDNKKTNVMMCLLCRNNPAKEKSMFFMSKGSKNELSHTKTHFENNHRSKLSFRIAFINDITSKFSTGNTKYKLYNITYIDNILIFILNIQNNL